MTKTCGNPECDRYSMTVAEFKLLCAEQWGSGFDAKLGLAAKKLCLQIHGKVPPKQRYRIAGRNKVPAYPCGVLEQAYRQLRTAGTA
jgi:hypothetical protein